MGSLICALLSLASVNTSNATSSYACRIVGLKANLKKIDEIIQTINGTVKASSKWLDEANAEEKIKPQELEQAETKFKNMCTSNDRAKITKAYEKMMSARAIHVVAVRKWVNKGNSVSAARKAYNAEIVKLETKKQERSTIQCELNSFTIK